MCIDELDPSDIHLLAVFLNKAVACPRILLWGKSSQVLTSETDMSYGKQDLASPKAKVVTKAQRLQKAKSGKIEMGVVHSLVEMGKIAKGLEGHLRGTKELQELKLVGVRFGMEGWKALSRGLADARGLRYFGIISCELSDTCLYSLATGLISIQGLRKLDLSHNLLSKACGFDISRIISQQGERRDEVIWAHGLRGETPTQGLSEGLEQLSLAFNQISDTATADIARVLHSDVWLKVLDLRQNELSEVGVTMLAEVLKTNKSLLFVDVRSNQCPDDLNAHRIIYNRLRRNVIRYRKKHKRDDNQWERRLLELAACIDPEAVAHPTYQPEVETADFNFAQEFRAALELEEGEDRVDSPIVTERILEEDCENCRNVERRLHTAEDRISELETENAQLRKQIQLLRIQHFSQGSISQHTLTNAEIMSVTGASQKPAQGGTGEELDSNTLFKIEQMMNELTRLMDALETSGHRTGTSG